MVSRILTAAVMTAAAIMSQAAAGDASTSFLGKWRITRSVVAPWTDEAGAGAQPVWIGSGVTFGEQYVKGPHPIGCRHAVYDATSVPPAGLFQGADLSIAQVNELGLGGGAVSGVSVSCDTGVFDYHYADDDTLLLALDNRIWTLDRTAGTRASKGSPEGALQRFLETHFAGNMSFSRASIGDKSAALAQELVDNFRFYFAKSADPDEAPEINGDPFTDSQEYPARFAVGAGDRTEEGIVVPVEFADAFSRKTVLFVMSNKGRRWLIRDVIYSDGSRLSATLTNQ